MVDRKTPEWADVKKELTSLDREDLVFLVRDLFRLSTENSTFLAARFLDERGEGPGIEGYREIIERCLFPEQGTASNSDLERGREVIRDYRNASGDIRGTLDLMLTYAELGAIYTRQFVAIDIHTYRILAGALDDFISLLFRNPRLYPEFAQRMRELRQNAYDIGRGYGEYAHDNLYDLELNLGIEE